MRPTIAKINLTRLNNNISRIKQQIGPNTALMAIVKANGYGHGGIEIAKHSLVSGAVSLGVAIPQEGVELRSAGINCDILVLGGISRDEIDLSLEYDLSLCIYSIGTATLINQRARQKNKKVKIHIKIDTGMGRIGVRGSNEALNLCKALDDMDHLIVEGVFTHLACSDELDSDYSRGQLETFNSIIMDITKMNGHYRWTHVANTASLFNYPESHFNMVRSGIGIYGYLPQSPKRMSTRLDPILSWHTKVAYIKNVNSGESISYSRSFIPNESRIIATLPVGYGDGYKRLLSNKGWVLIKGQKAPIKGNICMDQMMVDITDIPNVEIGEDVVLIGEQEGHVISAYDLAKLCETIPYEILTSISPRVPKLYMEDKIGQYL